MPAYKEKNSPRWYVSTKYTDWQGVHKRKLKRGFATKREALEWERKFQLQSTSNMDMTFEAFVELYYRDIRPRLKENTFLTKANIINGKIVPYFAQRKVSEITAKDVRDWQNMMLAHRDEKGKPYAPGYLSYEKCVICVRLKVLMDFVALRLSRGQRKTANCLIGII